MNEEFLYHYRVLVTSVYDGDTCTVDIDLGLGTWIRGEKLRLYRIDAPEIRGPEHSDAIKARDFLRGLIQGKDVHVVTIKDRKGKYGRYLAEIWAQDQDGAWVNVNDLLVEKGYAEYKEY
ncbi:MAG: nuclease [Chloroflexi bacterium]|nr:nuclease [Chloroflexota bacterium]